MKGAEKKQSENQDLMERGRIFCLYGERDKGKNIVQKTKKEEILIAQANSV